MSMYEKNWKIRSRIDYQADPNAESAAEGHSSPSLWRVQTRSRAMVHAGQICQQYHKTLKAVVSALILARDDEDHALRPVAVAQGEEVARRFAQCFADLEEFSSKSKKKPLGMAMDIGVFKDGFNLVNALIACLKRYIPIVKQAENIAEHDLALAKQEAMLDEPLSFYDANYRIHHRERITVCRWYRDLLKIQNDFIQLRAELGYDKNWKPVSLQL